MPPPTKEPSLHGLSDPPPPEVLSEKDRKLLSDRALLEHSYELAAGIAHRLELVYTRVNDLFVTFVRLDAQVRELQFAHHELEKEHTKTREMIARESTRIDDIIEAVNESPAVRDVMTTGQFDDAKLQELVAKATRSIAEREELERYREKEKEEERKKKEARSFFKYTSRKVLAAPLAALGTLLVVVVTWLASSCAHKVPIFPAASGPVPTATDAPPR